MTAAVDHRRERDVRLSDGRSIRVCEWGPEKGKRYSRACMRSTCSTFNHYKHSAEAVQLVTSLARSATAWQLTYNDPGVAAELLSREPVGD